MATMEFAATTLVRLAGDAMVGLYRHAPGFEARMTRDTWLVVSGEPHPLLNWIAVIEPGPAAEIALRDHVASLRARGVPALVFLPPAAAGAMASLCPTLGLVDPDPVPLMLCRLADLAAPHPGDGVTIEPVRDAATLRTALNIVAASFDMPADPAVQATPGGTLAEPALTFTVAKRRNEIASVVATTRIGPLVYVDLMATSVNHKRQGIGYALLHHVLAGYAAAGATDAYLISSDDGKRLYERLGFRELYDATVWEVPATIAAAG
jgi:hypothetical protein